MTDTTYNGWTNYATWRINLELIDQDYYIENFTGTDTYELSLALQNYVESLLEETSDGITLDYALAFISDVNWYEIAEHIADNFPEEIE